MSESKSQSVFDTVKSLPPDAIFFTKQRFREDKDSRKMNVGIGAYRTDDGKPYVLKIVKKVEKEMVDDPALNNEYLGITGDPEFVEAAQKLMFGASDPAIREGRTAGAQSISGTGALRVLMEFIKVNYPDGTIYLSNPTWGNHKKIIAKAGLKQGSYRYWKEETRALDIHGMLEDLSKMPRGSFVLLHACAHNPTGVDPTMDQWKSIADAMQKNGLVPFFDSAYQGFATGNLDNDAAAVRLFAKRGFEFVLAQSFAKNLGLYGQRIGCASVYCGNQARAKACQTQLAAVIRPMYSNPPKHGAEIVKRILRSKQNFNAWQDEMTLMSGRILAMRKALRGHLEKLQTPGTWRHITDQIGMFSFTGLTPPQCDEMISKHHVYLLSNGRISMAGVNSKNVEYLAKAMDDVVRRIK